jgi:hypothetical protein
MNADLWTTREADIIGRVYFERGRTFVVIARWEGTREPKDVVIRCDDGQLIICPFRGKLPA